MSRRLKLQELLESILGSTHVYFQPPENLKMQYDCIVYEQSKIEPTYADNQPYHFNHRYQVTAIYKNPDSDLPEKLAALPKCSHKQHFTASNMNHDVFDLYYD
jgi:hypothetical protein